MTITLTKSDGTTVTANALIKWTGMTPFVGAVYMTKVSIPGGDGIGRVYVRGHDNRVATLTGIVKYDSNGLQFLRDVSDGTTLMVTNSILTDGVTCVADTPTVTESSGAWIKFSLTLTEVR